MDPKLLFVAAMTDTGLMMQDEIVADGCIHRFKVGDDKDKSGWYVFHPDPPAAGAYGCFRRDIFATWCSRNLCELNSLERDLFKDRMQAARDATKKDLENRHAECSDWSKNKLSVASAADENHPYLVAKGVKSYGLKQIGGDSVALMVPVQDINGGIHGVQFIRADGSKKFKYGTNKVGNFFLVREINHNASLDIFLLCEGYATGASLLQATGYPAVVAFDKGNLTPVAKVLRQAYPGSKIIICVDNDQYSEPNQGLIRATEASRAVNGFLAVPVFKDTTSKPTDFNDLHRLEGLEIVKQQVVSAVTPADPESSVTTPVVLLAPDEPLPLIRPMQANIPFPVDSLPLIMRNAVIRVHDVIQAPLDMICQSFLAAATLVAQPHADLEVDGRRFPLSNNYVSVAESGERKTAVDKIATGPIKEQQRRDVCDYYKLQSEYEAAHAAWKMARDQALKERSPDTVQALLSRAGFEPQHILPFYITEEPTFEGIARAFSEGRHTLGLFSDEGGRFLGGFAMNKDNVGKTITGLSKLWDGDPIDRVRAGDGSSILYGRRFSMHLMIQPALSGQLFGSNLLIGQGFLSRSLCCYPSSSIGSRVYRSVDLSCDADIQEYNCRMSHILGMPLPLHHEPKMGLYPRIIKMTEEAKAEWIDFANEVEKRQQDGCDLCQIKGFASKAAEHAARIAGVLDLFEEPEGTEVGVEAIRSGIAIVRYYLGETVRLFHAGGDDPDLLLAQKVYDWGMLQGGIIALADLYRLGPNKVRDKRTANRMMSILVDHHRAAKIEGGAVVNGNRRLVVWHLR